MTRAKTTTKKKPATKKSPAKKPATKKSPAKKPVAKKPVAKKTPAKKSFELPRGQRPPKIVSRDLFLVWRAPRIGAHNPTRMTNPSWAWLARNRELSAWGANAHFAGPSSLSVGPCWCFQRFGRTDTTLSDGRIISIGGEHEDHYDPDFYIYNDVVVTDPSGTVDIFNYPRETFAPTDFHSATLVGDRIVVIGCLGYPEQRTPGFTPVYSLDTSSLAFTRLDTTGDAPGWIFEHSAELASDGRSITVRGGRRAVSTPDGQDLRENIDEWSLDLDTLAWKRLTDRHWPVWELAREDGERHHLLTIEWMSWHAEENSRFDRDQLAKLKQELGWMPDFELYAARFSPPVEHTKIESDSSDVPRVIRLSVAGVTVRYVEEYRDVRVTFEGSLAEEVMAKIVEDAREKLSALERSPWVAKRLEG